MIPIKKVRPRKAVANLPLPTKSQKRNQPKVVAIPVALDVVAVSWCNWTSSKSVIYVSERVEFQVALCISQLCVGLL